MSPDPNNNNNNINNGGGSDSLDVTSLQKRQYAEDVDLWSRLGRVCVNRLDEMTKNATATNDPKGAYQMGEMEKEMIQQLHVMGVKEGILAGICTMILLRRGPILFSRYLYQRQMQNQYRTSTGQQPHSSSSSSSSSSSTYQLSKPPNLPPASNNGSNSSSNPFQRAAQQQQQGSSSTTGSSFPPPPPPSFEQWQNPRPRSFIIRSAWFGLDLTISLLAAASIGMAYTDTPKVQKQLEELPLIQGRSLVAEAFCDSLELEFNQVRREKHPSYERIIMAQKQQEQAGQELQFGNNSGNIRNQDSNQQQQQPPLSEYLTSLLIFVEHCQRRRAVEQEIRQSRGWTRNQKVAIEIPPPGVPRNGPRLALVQEDEQQGDGNGDFVVSAATNDDGGDWSISGDGGGGDEAMDDANRFVMDQGEDDNESQRKDNRKKNGGETPKRGWW
jgi:hypothetical protein